MANLSLPSHAQWGDSQQQVHVQNSQPKPTVAEIQKIEEEEERRLEVLRQKQVLTYMQLLNELI